MPEKDLAANRWQPTFLAKFCQNRYHGQMSTMNISLPDLLKTYVDEQVEERGYGTSSEYVRALIRKDQERTRLRAMLIEGATSPTAGPADGAYFDGLRKRVRRRGSR
jgi:antitoxin ParD1/3/4